MIKLKWIVMRIGFRQGIIKGQRLPDFLIKNGNYVNFNASRMPTLLNFAEGSSNYLVYERESLDSAWEIPTNQECWLYWDISKETGVRTFGYTILNPFIKREPTTPVIGQMFFDTDSMRYRVWNGQSWTDIIRLIAGYVSGDGILTVQANGSQVDIVTSVMLDEIIFDVNGLPIKKFTDSGFEFYTKSNIGEFKTNNKDSFTFDKLIHYNGKTEIAMTQHSCVSWKDSNTLMLADPNNIKNKAFALVERTVDSGEIVSLQTKGFVTNRFQWNWTEPCNTPIFLGSNGSISTRLDNNNSIQKIGYIVSPNTIYLNFTEQYINYNSVYYQDTIITPTPSTTVSLSVTPTVTVTPTISVSFSLTPTPTPTLTSTLTPTPSVGSTDPHFANVVSLAHFDGANGSTTISDVTGRIWTPTNGPTISTSKSKFGGSSLYFTNNYSYIDSAITSIGTSDFTIEGFVNWAGVTSNFSFFFDYRSLSTNGIFPCVYISTDGTVHYFVNNGDRIVSATSLTSNVWYHIALCRASGVTRLFINGVQAGVNYTDTNDYIGSNLRLGGSGFDPNSGVQFGYIDEFRATYGYSRYTANFTPPTIPFPNQ